MTYFHKVCLVVRSQEHDDVAPSRFHDSLQFQAIDSETWRDPVLRQHPNRFPLRVPQKDLAFHETGRCTPQGCCSVRAPCVDSTRAGKGVDDGTRSYLKSILGSRTFAETRDLGSSSRESKKSGRSSRCYQGRRCSLLKRRRPPNGSFRTRFSSWRYSRIFCCSG